jgi:predicted N-acetyltransferase YhbS
MTIDIETIEHDTILIRALRPEDVEAIVDIDAANSRPRRPQYFRSILDRPGRSPVQVSLAAEIDGRVVGYILASLFYGEYGIAEPVASIDAIGVRPDARRQRVAHALMEQLRSNVAAVNVTTFRTEVPWSNLALLGFFASEGFSPAQRLCLEAKVR